MKVELNDKVICEYCGIRLSGVVSTKSVSARTGVHLISITLNNNSVFELPEASVVEIEEYGDN